MNHYLAIAASTGLVAALLAFAHPAVAITIPVNDATQDLVDDNPGDGVCHTTAGTCTLRAAFMEANHASGAGATISIPAGIYRLTRSATIVGCAGDDETCGDLNLTAGSPVITITGAGAATTIIDANQIDRVLNIDSGRSVSISGVTMRNGYLDCGSGAGIFNSGALTLSHSTLEGNEAHQIGCASDGSGGGLYNSGTATISTSTFLGNKADLSGGGIFNSGGTVDLADSTIVDSMAQVGGGIFNHINGSLYVTASTINRNAATAGSGGGIANVAVLFVTNSTISGNSASVDGGGIFNEYYFANIYNTTIVFNGANLDHSSGGTAGGVYNADAHGASFTLRDTLIAGNYDDGTRLNDECTGTLNSYLRNLIGIDPSTVGCTVVLKSGYWQNLNGLSFLGPLQNNGGPTRTHALLPGSNAIDYGSYLGCTGADGNPLLTDQRGFKRPVGVVCDMGAYEYNDVIFANGFQ
ncbi:MAG: choice-of-anchor Q domain-containing protein [Rudaea sp.]